MLETVRGWRGTQGGRKGKGRKEYNISVIGNMTQHLYKKKTSHNSPCWWHSWWHKQTCQEETISVFKIYLWLTQKIQHFQLRASSMSIFSSPTNFLWSNNYSSDVEKIFSLSVFWGGGVGPHSIHLIFYYVMVKIYISNLLLDSSPNAFYLQIL
jgi:hypothetical protein